ncbi:MAG: hypothetical protein PHN45_08980 [Methylococcales bacterium]|nr:hypothetical protein [Methylococcales bacterium]MDD5754871.1 hypothetical protein [Methylococcales bacterium]
MSKKKLLLLIASVIALVVMQREFLIPMAKDVATKSDLFLVESKDQGSMMTQSNEMTQFAFQHCNTHLKADLDPKTAVTLPQKALNAWSLGNYEYVVSAEAEVSHEGSAPKKHKYVCRISYKNGDDTSGGKDFENWSLDGLSKVDDAQ